MPNWMEENCWICIAEEATAASYDSFISALNVWINRPNVINKRVLGAVKIHNGQVEDASLPFICKDISTESLFIRELIPKTNGFVSSHEAVHINNSQFEISFYPLKIQEDVETLTPSSQSCCSTANVTTPLHTFMYRGGGYRFKYNKREQTEKNSIALYIQDHLLDHVMSECKGILQLSKEWLKYVLLPKLCKWSLEEDNEDVQFVQDTTQSLVSLEEYCVLYKQLKDKYGPQLVKNWPESTDPHKFVYEDIAIATYLLILWKEERLRHGVLEKQSYIDLGCGNGLLVYILSGEGHPGKGIDLRPRKIWRMLTPKANLEVASLTPSNITRFPEYDWLIGNHSDELTPWIPVMAARSSYSSKYFILPCCAHDFDKKFCRPTSAKSQYHSYLDYVKEIGDVMGFVVLIDTLRIPSSKRVCLIGKERRYKPEDESLIEKYRKDFISNRCGRKLEIISSSEKDEDKDGHKDNPINEVGEKIILDEEGKHGITNVEEKGSMLSHQRHGILSVPPSIIHPICTSSSESSACSPTISSSSTLSTSAITTTCVSPLSSATPLLPPPFMSSNPIASPHTNTKAQGMVWAEHFKPREVYEAVRNCSQIKHEIKDSIVAMVTKVLLKEVEWIEVELPQGEFMNERNVCGSLEKTGCNQTKLWNRGGRLHLNDVAALIDKSTLARLKKEYGGLQTLLRNHCQVFEVKGGYVRLRNWSCISQSLSSPKYKDQRPWKDKEKELLVKTKLCWFDEYHPQGCPRPSYLCPYAHGREELKERPDFKNEVTPLL